MAPQVPGFDAAPTPQPLSLLGQFLRFFGRLLGAILLLGLAILVGAGLLLWKPTWVEEVRTTLHQHTALSFAVGILVNVLALAVIGILWVLVCTRPPGLLMGVALLGLNLAGLAAVGDEIGRRVETRLGRSYVPTVRMAIGLAVPGAVLGILYIMGFCFQFFAFVGLLVLASFGAGAVLVKLLKLGIPAPDTAVAPVPAASAPETMPNGATTLPATVAAVPGAAETPAGSPAAASEAESNQAPPVIPPAEGVEAPVTRAPLVEATATPADPTADLAPDSEATPAAAPTAAPTAVDDFTRIVGIGPTFNQRLQAAGIRTYAELAGKTPEEIAAAIGWPNERVVRDQIIEQARKLAG